MGIATDVTRGSSFSPLVSFASQRASGTTLYISQERQTSIVQADFDFIIFNIQFMYSILIKVKRKGNIKVNHYINKSCFLSKIQNKCINRSCIGLN